jgi:trans-aconitate 2-methyltransferase
MPSWNPEQYLKFSDERTQPCRDLVARISLSEPRLVVDLGCGPGNSTAVLAAKWPNAYIIGVDNSAEMIRAARAKFPNLSWQESDLTAWDSGEPADLLFSNAALQWAPDHQRVIPRLFSQTAAGGALAWQVPANLDAPAQRLMRDMAGSSTWRDRFTRQPRDWFTNSSDFYYDLLASRATRVEIWRTEYYHILDNTAAIVEWYKGTGLRPFLDVLQSQSEQAEFLEAYLREIERAYPRQPDGRILFPFLRQFLIAYR